MEPRLNYFLYLNRCRQWLTIFKKGAVHIFSIFYTHHRVPNEHMMTINFDTITNNYMKLFMWSKLMKYYWKKIDTSFHQRSLSQRFPNMVQRLFAGVIHLIGTNYTPFLVDFFLFRMKQEFHKETNEGNPDRLFYIPLYRIARNHGYFCSWIFISQIVHIFIYLIDREKKRGSAYIFDLLHTPSSS
jgi:hypothetical protein